MVSGPGLQQQLDQKIRDIKQVVSGVDEQKALERPAEGEWCIKEVLSHLAGQDNANVMHRLKRILDEDTPNLDITPGVSAYARASFSLAAALHRRNAIHQARQAAQQPY